MLNVVAGQPRGVPVKPITVAVLACFLVLSIVPILAGCGSNPVATQNQGQSSQSNLTEKATGDEAAVEEVIKKFGAASDGTQNQEAASKFCTADGKVGLFSSPEGSFGEMIGFSNFQVSNSGWTNSCKINVTLTG